ncbi:MAG: hypothetical protein CL891_04910 [Dehalococcoidia bacterium]|nr:hypothetical protein [Dehalococcoidia bacterium]
MADLRPFRALSFNPFAIGNYANVICPPYDVISPEMQDALYEISPFNMIRLERGKTYVTDDQMNNSYSRASKTLSEWIEKDVLIRDKDPAFYLIQHSFNSNGNTKSSLGIMVGLKLEDYKNRIVLPHEFTQKKAKDDRFSLMEHCHSNFSHIMLLYRDSEKKIVSVLNSLSSNPSDLSLSDSSENTYSLWRINDVPTIQAIQVAMEDKRLYIADGHHRYETALNYKSKYGEDRDPNDPLNFTMAYLVEFDDPGFSVLPYHRVIKGLDESQLNAIKNIVQTLFHIHAPEDGNNVHPTSLVEEIVKRGATQPVLGMFENSAPPRILTLKPDSFPQNESPIAKFEAWLLEKLILEVVLGETVDEHVTWLHNEVEAIDLVKSGEYQIAFLLNAISLELFEEIVDHGERLPRKSTFFSPKLPTGFTINLLNATTKA